MFSRRIDPTPQNHFIINEYIKITTHEKVFSPACFLTELQRIYLLSIYIPELGSSRKAILELGARTIAARTLLISPPLAPTHSYSSYPIVLAPEAIS